MTKVELNSRQWHRKFDGKLDVIDFNFKKKDSIEKKISKVYDLLACGQIENYIDDEDVDDEDLTDDDTSDDDESDDKSSKSSKSSSTDKESESESDDNTHKRQKKKYRVPSKLNIK